MAAEYFLSAGCRRRPVLKMLIDWFALTAAEARRVMALAIALAARDDDTRWQRMCDTFSVGQIDSMSPSCTYWNA